jgi:23S rRNA pseudouridine2605 synthase
MSVNVAIPPVRIAKIMAMAGLCSRREAEAWILAGRVRVDDEILTSPARNVSPVNKILIDQKPFRWPMKSPKIWLYYKPDGLLVTNRDPAGRPTIFDHLPKSLPRVVTVGRLDLNSEGLLLLTNDGALARYLELPKNALARHYRVRVYGDIPPNCVPDLARGVMVEGVEYAPVQAEIDKITGRNTWLYLTLREGKNREIRKLMAHFGLRTNRLIRQAYGPFALESLKPGGIREVPSQDLPNLIPGFFGIAQKSSAPEKRPKQSKRPNRPKQSNRPKR